MARALAYPYGRASGAVLVSGGRWTPLDPAAADPAGRTAWIGYGANASPERLARKLAGHGPAPVLPATLRDHDVVHSAHLTRYGAVPATLWPSPGTRVAVTLALLTDEQAAAVARTEGGNYDATPLDPALLDPPPPAPPMAHRSRFGALALDGAPVALAAVAATGRRLPAATQAEVLARVADLVAPGRTAEDLVLACVDDPAARRAWTARLPAATAASPVSPRGSASPP